MCSLWAGECWQIECEGVESHLALGFLQLLKWSTQCMRISVRGGIPGP